MDKNYYDWLEISKNASPEIIEKAYKTLAKKYHPDLQQGDKSFYEETIKKINEAYEVLSNPQKKQEYDSTLVTNTTSNQDIENLFNENKSLKNEIDNLKRTNNITYTNNTNFDKIQFEQNLNNAINKAYHDAYIEDLKMRGYKIKYKRTFKDYIRIFITFLVIILVFILIYQIPYVKNYFYELYSNNSIVKFFVDTISNLFRSVFAR